MTPGHSPTLQGSWLRNGDVPKPSNPSATAPLLPAAAPAAPPGNSQGTQLPGLSQTHGPARPRLWLCSYRHTRLEKQIRHPLSTRRTRRSAVLTFSRTGKAVQNQGGKGPSQPEGSALAGGLTQPTRGAPAQHTPPSPGAPQPPGPNGHTTELGDYLHCCNYRLRAPSYGITNVSRAKTSPLNPTVTGRRKSYLDNWISGTR